jgi:CRISPR-associated protein Cmr4
MTCLAGHKLLIERNGKKGVVLEEYRFETTGEFPKEWEDKLRSVLNDAVLMGAQGRFVLLSDGDLSHFAITACQVNQHVRIDDASGTAEEGGLFNEEAVPSETLFYSALTETRKPYNVNGLFDALVPEQLIQFGGNGTTGLGFCTVKLS